MLCLHAECWVSGNGKNHKRNLLVSYPKKMMRAYVRAQITYSDLQLTDNA